MLFDIAATTAHVKAEKAKHTPDVGKHLSIDGCEKASLSTSQCCATRQEFDIPRGTRRPTVSLCVARRSQWQRCVNQRLDVEMLS